MKLYKLFALPLAIAFAGCHSYTYRPAPLAPPVLARSLEARNLDDPALRDWMQHAAGLNAFRWPLTSWFLDSLTLAAYYFSPDLDLSRAHAAAADAAIQTAGMKPNPSLMIGPGYETAPE